MFRAPRFRSVQFSSVHPWVDSISVVRLISPSRLRKWVFYTIKTQKHCSDLLYLCALDTYYLNIKQLAFINMKWILKARQKV